MPVFPTQYSTLSSTALQIFLQSEYGFEILACTFLLRGVNDHYQIETKDQKYIFRIYRNTHRSFQEISSEVFFLNVLKEKGVGISFPIRTLNEEQILEFDAAEGTRYGVLFSYAQGESLDMLSDQQLANLGEELARIHQFSAEITLPFERREYNLDTTILQPIHALKPILDVNSAMAVWITETKERVISKFKTFDLSKFSYGYCHYDLFPKNFHFDHENQITFFDFDFLGKGYLVNDLMTFWLHLSLHATFKKITQEEADRQFSVFIAAYRGIRQLHENEIAAIPYLSFGFWIFFMNFHQEHFDDFSNPFFNARYINQRLDLIKTLTDRYCRF